MPIEINDPKIIWTAIAVLAALLAGNVFVVEREPNNESRIVKLEVLYSEQSSNINEIQRAQKKILDSIRTIEQSVARIAPPTESPPKWFIERFNDLRDSVKELKQQIEKAPPRNSD